MLTKLNNIKPNHTDLPPEAVVVCAKKDLCKYFEPGRHVKVISGSSKGATGLVVSAEGHVVNLLSDTIKELLHVFADNVVDMSQALQRLFRGRLPMSYRGRRRGGRGHDALIGAGVKIRRGPYKGCKGRVVDIKGMSVRVELEAPMKVVTSKCFFNVKNGPHFLCVHFFFGEGGGK
ncbi:putative transcription elongation factor SPT5 homolog 1 [Lycium ferocissimum]|uniref:putative transcription elongation factor SPT5 homolog 1 n=1 Tax=Lycium ferocissimum TaxID=112874 RepID=UPI00281595A4|nr:putative transcription elongation factor SPT5 homolog 1 [Lycium ferocissimum]